MQFQESTLIMNLTECHPFFSLLLRKDRKHVKFKMSLRGGMVVAIFIVYESPSEEEFCTKI